MPTSIVNQTIESPVTRDGSFDQLLNLFDLGNVAANEVGLSWSSFIHFGGECSAGAFAFRTKNHLRPGGYEGTHAAFPYTTAAAGDDDYFVGVAHLIMPFGVKKARRRVNKCYPPPRRACLITSGGNSPFAISSSQSEAAIESTVFAGPLPGLAESVTRVNRVTRVSDFPIAERHQRRIPNQVRHLATEIVGHRFDVN